MEEEKEPPQIEEKKEENKTKQRLFFIYDLNDPMLAKVSKIMSSIGSFLPIISTLLLAISLIRVYLYYSYFQINILDYINLTELLSPLLLDLASLIIIVSSFTLGGWLGNYFLMNFTESAPKMENMQYKLGNKTYKGKFASYVYNWVGMIVGLVLLASPLVAIMFLIKDLIHYLNLRILVNGFFALPILVILLAFTLQFKTIIRIHIIHLILIWFILVMFISAILEGYSLPADFYANKKLHTTRIIFEDSPEPLKLDSVFVIGLTQDYVFLYNDIVKMPQVRKRSDIKVMSPGVFPLSNAASVDNKRRK